MKPHIIQFVHIYVKKNYSHTDIMQPGNFVCCKCDIWFFKVSYLIWFSKVRESAVVNFETKETVIYISDELCWI
jgi:hypothetical protein